MSNSRTTIKDPDQIPAVLDVIHDCWFNIDDILFNPETSVLSIKFKREMTNRSRVIKKLWVLKKIEMPLVECFLKFHHVKSYTIKDTEQVGFYNFTDLEYEPETRLLSIITGVPINIEIVVENFEICVEVTDTITEMKTTTSIFN